VFYIFNPAGRQVIISDDLAAFLQKSVYKVAANETGAAGNEYETQIKYSSIQVFFVFQAGRLTHPPGYRLAPVWNGRSGYQLVAV
jgi:hypothetical protein